MAENILLLESINSAALSVFEEEGYATQRFDKSLSPDQLIDKLNSLDARVLGVRSGPNVSADVINATETLEAIGVFGVGTNHIDIEAASRRGIAVFNSVHENTRSVAEYVIASIFGLMRRIPEHSRGLHNGTWTKTDELSYEVRGKTLGIIGYGTIGSQVSVLAESIGMNVIYYDPAPQIPPHGRAKRLDSLEELLSAADVVTVHVPGGERTRGLIGSEAIDQMKSGSYLINTSRGGVVDYQAAREAITSGHLAGIAADVFENEPGNVGDAFDNVLRGVDRAILTPHIAGSTFEAQTDIGSKTASKLLTYLKTGSSVGSVNLPELSLNGLQPGHSRLLCVHDNSPGVSVEVSSRVAEARLNIASSVLKTRDDIGYLALDVEGSISDDLLNSVQQLDHIRRARVVVS